MTDQLFVARLRGPANEPPRFTRSAPLNEIVSAIVERLPADILYLVEPNSSGYSLKQIGLITIDIQTAPGPLHEPVLPQGEAVAESPTQPPNQANTAQPEPDLEAYEFDGRVQGKPQSVALAEKGLELPPSRPSKKPKAKPKPKQDEDDLPHPVSKSTRKVVRITKATEAEAAAASKIKNPL